MEITCIYMQEHVITIAWSLRWLKGLKVQLTAFLVAHVSHEPFTLVSIISIKFDDKTISLFRSQCDLAHVWLYHGIPSATNSDGTGHLVSNLYHIAVFATFEIRVLHLEDRPNEFHLNPRAITRHLESVFIPQVVHILRCAVVIRMGLNGDALSYLLRHFDLHSQIGRNHRPRWTSVLKCRPGSIGLTCRYDCGIVRQTCVGNIGPLRAGEIVIHIVVINGSGQFRRDIFTNWLDKQLNLRGFKSLFIIFAGIRAGWLL